MQSRRDEIAREAARLLEIGQVQSIAEAIRAAMNRHSATVSDTPSHGRVRRHLQGFAMQSMGQAAYEDRKRSIMEAAEEIMSVLEPYDPLLAGRAARGQLDGEVTLHIRIFTRTPLEQIADLLELHGCEDLGFETVTTRFGRLNRISFDEPAFSVRITRCLPEHTAFREMNLYRDERIATLSLEGLRRELRDKS